ncbi:tetratricopeptide repeat-containing hybrid sensor histidine kinase/response regulator [Christiangramia sabulilitoris]|uniref:histidine kinase n=1 Tax=Christiangramia sabulilitoris TaxID=2583991 RepID=A0A550I360_9FLAO|nr:response regulator [Christiangramia sabulilitoris]TRO65381.1 response regulator [Christiangramia sabulilitoris]
MKRSFFLCLVLCTFFWNSGFSQNPETVSEDSLKILADNISDHINRYNYEKAIEQSHQLLNLAGEIDSPDYTAKAYHSLGHIYTDQNDSARARKNYALGLEYAQQSKNDTIILLSYINLGNVYSEIPATVEKGMGYYNKVIELAEKLDLPEDLVISKSNIAWTYLDNGKYEKSFSYLNESLKILDSLDQAQPGYKEKTGHFYSPIYMLMARYHAFKNDMEISDYFFQQSIEIAERDSLYLQAAEAYNAYGEMLAKKGDYESAYKAKEKFILNNSKVLESEKLRQTEIANAKYKINQYKKDLLIAEKEQKYQHDIIQKSKEKVVVMVFSSIGMIFILIFLYKINRDRQRLIEKLKEKNVQYRDAKVEAEKLSMLKTKFFSTVSHEIRTPLYGVIGLTSLLLEDKGLKKHKNDLRSLKFSADYLLALINDVLQMNKMESNEVTLENVPFNLRDLINSIVNSFEFTRVQNKNKIHINIDESIPAYLIGDSVRLSQVLMNLVGNAMKFTERGNIYITLKQLKADSDTSKILFEIKDDGPGIPKSKRKVIFEEFSQLENSNYNYQGTGLGLPIVKRLLSLFGSEISLKSKEGEGSEFSFAINFDVDKTIQKSPEKELPSVMDDPISQKKILIVDDNRINQVVTKRVLEKKNFECEVAGDGHTAIELVKNSDFDLILMDVNMPGISGLDASREIRKFNTSIPILALTAVEVEEIREEIQSAGMSDIIIKPYDIQQFYQIVFKNLSHSRQTEEV